MQCPLRITHASLALLAGGAILLSTTACQDIGPLDPMASAGPTTDASTILAARSGDPAPIPYVGRFYTTSSVPAAPPPGCQLFLNTTFEGHASVLGNFTGSGTTCGYNGQIGVTNPPFSPAGGPPYFVSDFTVQQTHTASNGDQLEITGTGVFVQSLADGSSAIMGGGEIQGGTGRFVGATGAFSIRSGEGDGDPFTGWIALDASQVSLP